MAQDYTKEDLAQNNRIFANRLRTRVLQDFYTHYLTPQAYIYLLSNGETIHLLFENDQFCHLKREEIRITNFPKILHILDNPTVYLYKNDDMRYKSDYFAVWNDGKRYYKLGIGTSSSGVNYPETFQVSLMTSTDNKEIDPLKLLTVTSKFVMSKKSFKDLYYPKHILLQNQEKHIQELNTQLNKLRKIEWELTINTSTD